jgi:formate dehydrogenase (coenzyme F420) beta subunit
MATIGEIKVSNKQPVTAIQSFLTQILADPEISAVLAPARQAPGRAVMPSLITDPEQMKWVDPLAPAFPMNSAKILSKLTRGLSRRRFAAMVRPCEVRAFVELVKLNQGDMEGVILISMDCQGAFTNTTFREFQESAGDIPQADATHTFLTSVGKEDGVSAFGRTFPLATACQACEYPDTSCADLHINLLGHDIDAMLSITAITARGEGLLSRIGIKDIGQVPAHSAALDQLKAKREAYREAMTADTKTHIADMEKLSDYLSACVNCYNCRAACPVCYCKECVFLTDVFDHKPWQYLEWADLSGNLKMPTDTLFFHLTRLAHMSTSCVGCGQCSNACPNDIPVMELFRTVAIGAQKAFEYEPGKNPGEPPPLSVFKEHEFSEVTGGVD